MHRIKPEIDIVMEILEAVLAAQPKSSFTQSLLFQYQERGGLSKKQLEGLYGKACKIEGIPPGKLATLEAIILKRPTKNKSELPVATPLYTKDETIGDKLKFILEKSPAHKQIQYLKAKYDNNELFTGAEMSDLQRVYKLFSKK